MTAARVKCLRIGSNTEPGLIVKNRLDSEKRIGIAKGVFEVPDNIDTHNDEVSRLFTEGTQD